MYFITENISNKLQEQHGAHVTTDEWTVRANFFSMLIPGQQGTAMELRKHICSQVFAEEVAELQTPHR